MKITTVNIEGKTYPLVFSLNAAERIEDECVKIENIGDCLIKPEKYNKNGISVVKLILKIFINEGIKYCERKDIKEIDGKPIELVKVDDNLFLDLEYNDINKITKAIFNTMIDSKKKE